MQEMGTVHSVWRRGTAAFALLMLLVVTTVAPVHTAGDADADHAIAVAHDAQAHVFTTVPSPSGAPLHCLACHAARSFRPALAAVFTAAPVIVADAVPGDGDGALISPTRQTRPPLRAPPAASPALV